MGTSSVRLSAKQREIMRFPYTGKKALICDGAVRAGKTSVMSLSFVLWAMGSFDGTSFGICGKSVGAVERNILQPLMTISYLRKEFQISYSRSEHKLTVVRGKWRNYFYVFGGKDESSYELIQGITLAGVLLDEVALMPRSFVEQALARCSVEGARLWFNCNPESPKHWFYEEWILEAEKRNATHLHFLMKDNPSLSEETLRDYETRYTGVFYQRYILGLWVISEGAIYDMFDQSENTYTELPVYFRAVAERTITCDYGTTNPCVFYEVLDNGEEIRVEREYRWDSRKEQRQKTDAEYADDLITFMGEERCTVIVDPSAASFIAELKSRGVYVKAAKNDVMDGIRKMSTLIKRRVLKINVLCKGLLGELASYMWDTKASQHGEERPIKQNDHGPDAIRYYVNHLPKWRI